MNWKSRLSAWSRSNPAKWISRVLGGTLWLKQREIAQSIVENERTAVPACFSAGKTWLAARLALWFLYCFGPHCKVITSAPTGRQVKNLLWAELRTAHRQAKIKLGGSPLTLQLNLASDHFAVGFSTKDYDIDKFTGYHAPNVLIIFDQAGGLPKMFWEAGEALMTSEYVRWLAIGNTAIAEGEFANICEPERVSKYGEWNVIKIKATETPNVQAGRTIYPGLLPYTWVKNKLKVWGPNDPLYRVFAEAEFVASMEKVVINPVHIVAAFRLLGTYEDSDPIEIGLDVAAGGMDFTVWIARRGSRVLEIWRMTGNTPMEVVGETVRFRKYLEKTYEALVSRIKIDAIGIGSGIYSRLLELEEQEPVVPVISSEGAADKMQFANVRAEMSWALRSRFELGGVGLLGIKTSDPENIEMLRADCKVMRYKISSAGRILIWDKDDIKKLLKRSPDFWDALVYAFEEPGGGAPMVSFISSEVGKELEPETEDFSDIFKTKIDIDGDFIEI